MEFELSEELINAVIFSMEDQECARVMDSAEKKLEKKSDIHNSSGDRYYSLPTWDSINGFHLMERFVSLLHNPLAREELRAALSSGRGVFRNFKNSLKAWPEIERLWFEFKEKEMRRAVFEWYNMLRDAWGLERIGIEPEEVEDIVHDDFNFRPYDEDRDGLKTAAAIELINDELSDDFSGGLGAAFAAFWARLRSCSEQGNGYSFVAETLSGDFAACVSLCRMPEESLYTAVLTGLFVLPEYRGLGLAREMLQYCVTQMTRKGFRWLISAGLLLPREFIQVMYRQGFKNVGSVYVLDLLNEEDSPESSDSDENAWT